MACSNSLPPRPWTWPHIPWWALCTLLALASAPATAAAPSAASDPGAHARARLMPHAVSRVVEAALDLCAPCIDGSQCLTSLCPSTLGQCMQGCDADGACPSNFFCATGPDGVSVCVPNDDSVCPKPYVAPKNVLCSYPSQTSDPNAAIARDCASGLTCYLFPAAADGSGQAGVCVGACSSTDASAACAPDETCCFDTAADGSCVTTSTAVRGKGGCFVVGDTGASCVSGDHSYCAPGSTCAYPPPTSNAAACYGLCTGVNNNACPPGGYCMKVGGSQVCCNASTLNPNDMGTCHPLQGICRREVGVTCTANAQCRLNVCQKNGSASACSVACISDADCPAEDTDVNGDGTADGGGTCLNFGGTTRCWPKNGPAAPPPCALAVDPNATAEGHGCTCAGTELGVVAVLAPLALAARRLRRRRAG